MYCKYSMYYRCQSRWTCTIDAQKQMRLCLPDVINCQLQYNHVNFLGSALPQKAVPLMWSQGLQPHKASPMGWSSLLRISDHAAAALAVTLGFPFIERDLHFSLPASTSFSQSDSTLLCVSACLPGDRMHLHCCLPSLSPEHYCWREIPVRQIFVVFIIWGCNGQFLPWNESEV